MAGTRVLYHAPCLDGIVSAILARDILKEPQAECIPVGYGKKKSWLASPPVDGPFAVVDFLFHPDAVFWADHHKTTFLNEDARQVYAAPSREHRRIYDPTASSCASLLWNERRSALSEDREVLVEAADMTDAARYRDPKQALFGTEHHLVVNRALAGLTVDDRDALAELLSVIAAKGFEAAAAIDWVRTSTAQIDARTQHAVQKLGETSTGDLWVASFDWDVRHGALNRYAPWGVRPEAEYSVVLLRNITDSTSKITAMRNPWKSEGPIHLGDLAGALGGGGHHRVGSVIAPTTNAESVFNTALFRIQQATQ